MGDSESCSTLGFPVYLWGLSRAWNFLVFFVLESKRKKLDYIRSFSDYLLKSILWESSRENQINTEVFWGSWEDKSRNDCPHLFPLVAPAVKQREFRGSLEHRLKTIKLNEVHCASHTSPSGFHLFPQSSGIFDKSCQVLFLKVLQRLPYLLTALHY